MPGLRVGYIVVTGKHYQAIIERKLLHDLHTSSISRANTQMFGEKSARSLHQLKNGIRSLL